MLLRRQKFGDFYGGFFVVNFTVYRGRSGMTNVRPETRVESLDKGFSIEKDLGLSTESNSVAK
jgi:hypothetical protein